MSSPLPPSLPPSLTPAAQDAIRALAAERNHLRDLVATIRDELGLLDVHDDAEVLRAIDTLRHRAETAEAKLGDLRTLGASLHKAAAAGMDAERAAVVAWLRAEADAPHPVEAGERRLSPAGVGLCRLLADAIERGEHRRKEE